MKNNITNCFKNIKENMQTVNEIEKALYHKMDYETFKNTYMERGNKLRVIFKSNQKDLDVILNLLDFELNEDVVTVRNRDTMVQESVKISDLVDYFKDKLSF